MSRVGLHWWRVLWPWWMHDAVLASHRLLSIPSSQASRPSPAQTASLSGRWWVANYFMWNFHSRLIFFGAACSYFKIINRSPFEMSLSCGERQLCGRMTDSIKRTRVRITFAAASKFEHFRSLNKAPFHLAVYMSNWLQTVVWMRVKWRYNNAI